MMPFGFSGDVISHETCLGAQACTLSCSVDTGCSTR